MDNKFKVAAFIMLAALIMATDIQQDSLATQTHQSLMQ